VLWVGKGLSIHRGAHGNTWMRRGIEEGFAPNFYYCQVLFLLKNKNFCQIFLFFLFYHRKFQLVKYLIVSKKSLQSNDSFKKSPGSDAFDIYITNASVKGEKTVIWLALYIDTSSVSSTIDRVRLLRPVRLIP